MRPMVVHNPYIIRAKIKVKGQCHSTDRISGLPLATWHGTIPAVSLPSWGGGQSRIKVGAIDAVPLGPFPEVGPCENRQEFCGSSAVFLCEVHVFRQLLLKLNIDVNLVLSR